MMKSFFYLLFSFSLFAIIAGCKQEEPPQFHFEYFGMEEGRFIIYDVTSIHHDGDVNVHDTTIYQLKAYWANEYIDNEGREGREYRLYRRDSITGPWVITDVWHGVYDGIRAELVEENQRIVKLVFAPTLSKEWDANAYNMYDTQECYYRDIHQDTVINGQNFDSTLVVEMENIGNLIDRIRKYEMYAKHYGLVYKHIMNNTYNIGSLVPRLGDEFYMKYNSSGFE